MANHKEALAEVRNEINDIDKQLFELFVKRMDMADRVAEIKRANNLALTDPERERQVIEKAIRSVSEDKGGDVQAFASSLIALSKLRQKRQLFQHAELAFPAPNEKSEKEPFVAFQGVPGAWGEHAVMQMYPDAWVTNYEHFDDVFDAVTDGTVRYGILPIENSQTGAIGEVYDLLRKHGCYIVGQEWVDIRHCLLAKPETKLEDIKKVLSHPEGFRQSHKYLKDKHWEQIACSNTAAAAKTVSECEDSTHAAIGSPRAAHNFGLKVLVPDIMNNSNNRTRFISIAKEPEYDEKSSITGVTFSTVHESGTLCSVLQVFMVAGINLTRIESRPTAGGRYRFFADLQANIMDENVIKALEQAAAQSDYFEVLGCYPEKY